MSDDGFKFVRFAPGETLAGKIDLDLSEEVSWVGWLEINDTLGIDQRIITLGAASQFTLRVHDGLKLIVGECVASISDEHILYGDWVMVAAFARVVDGEVSLELIIDADASAIAKCRYEGPTKLTCQTTGGGDGDFGAAEIVVCGGIRTKRPRA